MERVLHILVVDDEQVVLDSVKKHLKKENYEIHTALLAREALEIMDSSPIDMVLTDLMMPEIDGLELMQEVKTRSPLTPVIMITGYATINTALQATQLGAFDYIAKPFTKSELIGVVHRAADLVRTAEAANTAAGEGVAAPGSGHMSGLKTVGDHAWMMVEDDGVVLLGVDRSFLHRVGKIQNIFLPAEGDELRQGSVYLQIFSSDLRSHTVLSPLSGTVVAVNGKVLENPASALEDPYGEGWLIRLRPSKFEYEIKELGL